MYDGPNRTGCGTVGLYGQSRFPLIKIEGKPTDSGAAPGYYRDMPSRRLAAAANGWADGARGTMNTNSVTVHTRRRVSKGTYRCARLVINAMTHPSCLPWQDNRSENRAHPHLQHALQPAESSQSKQNGYATNHVARHAIDALETGCERRCRLANPDATKEPLLRDLCSARMGGHGPQRVSMGRHAMRPTVSDSLRVVHRYRRATVAHN